MKRIFLIVLCGLNVANAGTITGTIRAQGKSVPESVAADGAYDSRRYKFAEKVNYDEMRDFVIYIEGPVGSKSAAPEKPLTVETRRTIEQKQATFSPHVLPMVVGTTVEWPNNDTIFHNVFSVSEAKPFDLDLYKNPTVKSVTFDRPGRVDVFCSIHASMNCIVLVLENPFFTTTDARGHYTITNVPSGTYKLKAWHERLPAQSKEIVVPQSGDVKLDFTLGISGLPRY